MKLPWKKKKQPEPPPPEPDFIGGLPTRPEPTLTPTDVRTFSLTMESIQALERRLVPWRKPHINISVGCGGHFTISSSIGDSFPMADIPRLIEALQLAQSKADELWPKKYEVT